MSADVGAGRTHAAGRTLLRWRPAGSLRAGGSGGVVGAFVGAVIVPFLLPVGLLLFWERAATTGAIDPLFFPPPAEIWHSFWRLVGDGSMGDGARKTIGRAFLAWTASGVAGVAVGVLFGWSWVARAALLPSFEFLRAIPAAAVAPVSVLILGPEPSTEVIGVAFAAFWPVLLNTSAGVVATEPLLLDAGRVCGLDRRRQALQIQIPSATPAIIAGLRISLWVCLIVAVIVEMVSATGGLGTLLTLSASRYRNAEVFAIVAVLGLVGFLANVGLQAVEGRLTRWQGSSAARRGRERGAA